MTESLLSVRNLRLSFATRTGPLHVLRGIDIDIAPGEVVALVGESGSGKSAFGKTLLRLLAPPYVDDRATVGGSVRFDGEDILAATDDRLRALRSRDIAMISQEALSGLNPVMRIGAQIAEAARVASPGLDDRKSRQAALDMIAAVGLPEPERRYDAFPHQLSGGQRQRVMIAMSAIRRPRLLIADEPTTALDVTVQARILTLLAELRQGGGMAMLFITHDLGVVASIAQRVAVMYAGQIVEQGSVAQVFTRPRHPYSAGLLSALPESPSGYGSLGGHPPDLRELVPGCAFSPRCRRASEQCDNPPPAVAFEAGSRALCWSPLQ